MKKFLSILMALLMTLSIIGSAALAEESVPQPEGGKKFESNWALGGGLISIVYEEFGDRVMVELVNNEDWSGTVWEYSCYYHEDTDSLVSVSSTKSSFTTDPETFDRVKDDEAYSGMDDEGQETSFVIAENGALVWTDGRENAGADLEFRNIGCFEGVWRSAEGEEPVWVEISWNGMDQETYNYTVFIHRGGDDAYTEYTLTGLYNEETGKLECKGETTSLAANDDGVIEIIDSDNDAEAFFSLMEDGRLLYEAANGIILEYDILGSVQNG